MPQKRKTSKARRDLRRSSVWKLETPALTKCGQCGELILAHRVCDSCGYYNGKQVLKKQDA